MAAAAKVFRWMLWAWYVSICLATAPKSDVLPGYDAYKGCTDDKSCSLNGVCTSGACMCDQGWMGSACETLDFAPAEKETGYRYSE